MKRFLIFLLILFITLSTVCAFDISFGMYTSDWEFPKKAGQTLSVSYAPFSYKDFDFGLKADVFTGILKPEKRQGREPGIHIAYAVKALADFNIQNFSLYSGIGLFSNTADLKNGKWGLDTEFGLKYRFNKNWAIGTSFSGAINVKNYKDGTIKDSSDEKLYSFVRLFTSYIF